MLPIVVFGDQSLDPYDFLAALHRRPRPPGLLAAAFLRQAGEALRAEVAALPRAQRDRLPVFATLPQLNEAYRAHGMKHAGVDLALLCAAQLGDYLDHSESHGAPPSPLLVGLCAGLFAAAAVAAVPSLSALVPVAVQAVLLAFRVGSYVQDVAAGFGDDDTDPSWTRLVGGHTDDDDAVRQALVAFARDHGLPAAAAPYVSAVAGSAVAVSGPPATLRQLVASDVLGRRLPALPVHGPYHAAHLHGNTDVRAVLGVDEAKTADGLYTGPSTNVQAVLSCATGTLIEADDAAALFTAVATEALTAPLHLLRVLDGCAAQAKAFAAAGGKQCVVLPFGPSQGSVTAAMEDALKKSGLQVETRTMPPTSAVPAPLGNHGADRPRLAVVGMAGRFPDAASHEALWALLQSGLDVHRTVPADRFDAATHVDPTGKAVNTSHTPFGCWIPEPGLFDARFFNMSPREALQTDPMQRLALTTAYEALEMAGVVSGRTAATRRERIGSFYGQTSDDWRELNAAQTVDTYFITGGVRAFGPGRIHYHFGFTGPALNIDTACSSSAAALQVACTALWAGDCDTALVGGLSVMTNPDIFAGLSRGQFLSKKGPCATFDDGADGYCRADGCATVVVKRLDDAEADGDRVLAVILGTATNHSADAVSITHPHGPTQAALSRALLDRAGVDPRDVDYVEMHGTGTQAGDGTEMASVTDVFAPAAGPGRRPSDRPLFLGSVKANVGHGEAASGVTALIKVLLMLQHHAIPPHVGIKQTINHTFPNLAARNVHIAQTLTPFARHADGRPRRVFVNNFSAAGGNTGLLLEEAAPLPPSPVDPRPLQVVAVSAKSRTALLNNAGRLAAWLAAHPEAALADVAYTTTARRMHHPWRLAIAAKDVASARTALLAAAAAPPVTPALPPPPVVMLFTGQGTPLGGRVADLYTHAPPFRAAVDHLDGLIRAHGFPSVTAAIANDNNNNDTSDDPVLAHLTLVTAEIALARTWAAWGLRPAAVLGHSLGAYAALHVAGVLSAADALFLVGTRAQLLVAACRPGTHAMLAVGGDVDDLPSIAGVEIACINSPTETVLSGSTADIAAAAAGPLAGRRTTALPLPFAFHSAQVEPLLEAFEEQAKAVTFHAPKVAVLSTLDGQVIAPGTPGSLDAHYLRRHAREPVDVHSALAAAQAQGLVDARTVWLESGPHPVVGGFVKACLGRETTVLGTLRRGEAAYTTLATTLSVLHATGVAVDWDAHHTGFGRQLVHLPAYAFDDKTYWLQYEGDWRLGKNRMGQRLKEAEARVKELEAGGPVSTPATTAMPILSTSSIHRLVREDITRGDTTTEVHLQSESDLRRTDLRAVLEGHLVNGTALCPSTLYADMALTLAEHAARRAVPALPKEALPAMSVADVVVDKTLILADAGVQLLHVSLEGEVSIVSTEDLRGAATLVFWTEASGRRTEHCRCRVVYGDRSAWTAEFSRMAHLVKGRVDAMKASSSSTTSTTTRGIAYKLFQALVDYAPAYRGMAAVVLDSAACEAAATVQLQPAPDGAAFAFSPYWLDSLCHVSGFVVNATDAVDSREQVFISHGWGNLRLLARPDPRATYTSYVRMQPVDGGGAGKGQQLIYAGDVYVFDGARIVAVCGDVRFAALPRKVLDLVLPPRGGGKGQAAKAAAKAVPAKVASATKTRTPVTHANLAKVSRQAVVARPTQSVVSRVFAILAEEVGVDQAELADAVAFADLGVDSLMGLTVAGRLREDLDLDLHSNAFLDYATVGAFKAYLATLEPEEPEGPEGPTSGTTSPPSSDSDLTPDTAATTPGLSVKDGDEGAQAVDDASYSAILRATIAAEMGVDVADVVAAPQLAELGMDSLMGLQVLGVLREATGLELPADLFTGASLGDVERRMGWGAPVPVPVRVSAPTPAPTPPADTIASSIGPIIPHDKYPHRKATSVLLQGRARNARRHLFLVPDGGGSATSYTEIAELDPGGRAGLAVWGLFSPFLKTPEEFDCGVPGMAAKFVACLRTRQPDSSSSSGGGYCIGGWSAGGVVAYEMVRQLLAAGERVDRLLLIDAPCPLLIEPLPRGLHAWFAEIGLLGGDNGGDTPIPAWLLPHFAASVAALGQYRTQVVPLPRDDNRHPAAVFAVWCEDGVCKHADDPRPEPYPSGHALFLLDNRTDFGPNRWDELVDAGRLTTRRMGGNHFTMMHGALAQRLGALLREGLGL